MLCARACPCCLVCLPCCFIGETTHSHTFWSDPLSLVPGGISLDGFPPWLSSRIITRRPVSLFSLRYPFEFVFSSIKLKNVKLAGQTFVFLRRHRHVLRASETCPARFHNHPHPVKIELRTTDRVCERAGG